MAGRTYTDRDKAKAWAELKVNNGNLKRTARNLNIPAPTLRRWRDEWEQSGVPESVEAEITPVVSDFLADALRIRGKLLLRIEDMIERGEGNLAQVSTALGIVSDKIRAYEAIGDRKTVEHTLVLPPAEELKALFSGLLEGVVDSARERAAEIEAIEEPAVTTTYRALSEATEE